MKYKNLIFDFDEVITKSLNVKTRAFYKMYLPFGEEIANKVVEHHKNNGGMFRFKKFRLYHKEFLNRNINDEEVQHLAKQFSSEVLQGVIDAEFVDGVLDFIKTYSDKCEFWIVSGTPTVEIREISKGKGIEKYFNGIFGSPESKSYWLNKIIAENNLIKNESLFLGDAILDYEAAKEANIDFALRCTKENEKLFEKVKNVTRFNDFYQFRNLFENFK